MTTELPLDDLRTDAGTQPRAEMDLSLVATYADAMERGDQFPPIDVVYTGEDYIVVDGFHRKAAALKAGRETFECNVEQGDVEFARWRSLGANAQHGKRRTREDKRRAIKKALKGWGEEKTNREIARHVGCSHPTVSKYRDELEASGKIYQMDEREVTRNGTTYKQDTSNIGTSDPAEETVEEVESMPDDVQDGMSDGLLTSDEAKEAADLDDETRQEAVDRVSTGDVEDFHSAKNEVEHEKKTEEYIEEGRDQVDKSEGEASVIKCDYQRLCSDLSDRSVDLLLTDPPYSTDVEDVESFSREWLNCALPLIKDSGRAYIFTGAYPGEVQTYLDQLLDHDRLEVRSLLTWTYRNTLGQAPSDRYKLNYQMIFYVVGPDAGDLHTDSLNEKNAVQDINAPDGRHGNRVHRWQKPDEIGERFVRHSTRPGDLVCDPFVGSGTFVLEAAKQGRRAIGCDPDDEAIELCVERGATERLSAMEARSGEIVA